MNHAQSFTFKMRSMMIGSRVVFGMLVGFLALGLASTADAQILRRGTGVVMDHSSRPMTPGESLYWIPHSTWGDYWARNQAMQRPWHGNYYYLRTGQPTALVVSPMVTMQSNYSWGVSQNTMTPVYHQFLQGPASGSGGGEFRATPYWPSHTDQFGVYPVRGPWW